MNKENNNQSVVDNLKRITASLPQGVRLVAVSKYHPNEEIMACLGAGHNVFGESREQELRSKYEALPKDIEWHFIGHLQTNKVKYIAPYISCIHAVDSEKLLLEIEKQAAKNQRKISVLLQLHVAQEETKYGFTKDELLDFFHKPLWRNLHYAKISGIMCMASHTDDIERIRQDFRTAKDVFYTIKTNYFLDDETFCERSYGMSDDYHIAIEEGATLVRIGSSLFGESKY